MSLSAKIDEAISTDTVRQIGEATIKAFGDAKELAGAGVEATVNYVWWSALISMSGALLASILVAVLAVWLFRNIEAKCCGKRDMFPNFASLGVGLFVAATFLPFVFINAPIVANPQGYIIYSAIKK